MPEEPFTLTIVSLVREAKMCFVALRLITLAIIFQPSRIIQSYGMSVKCISVRFRSFRLRVKQSELFDGHKVNRRLSLFCKRHTQQPGYKGTRMGTRRIAE